jgi:hypothetical protein
MTLQEMVISRLRHLSQQEQLQVWEFVSSLPHLAPAERKNPIGMFDHLGVHIDKETIDEASKEAWAKFPREFPDESE